MIAGLNSLEHILNVVIRVSLLEQSVGRIAHEKGWWVVGHIESFPEVVVPHEIKVQEGHGHTDEEETQKHFQMTSTRERCLYDMLTNTELSANGTNVCILNRFRCE